MTQSCQKRFYAATLIVLFTLQLFAVVGGPELPDPGNPHMSREQQEQLGLQAAAQVYKQMPVLPDNSSETQYIRQIGERLAATIPSEHSWPFEFHVVAQKEINAFALPGGPMFVNIGTISAAANEAQLAGVMAHEMGHVYMQHSAKQAEKAAFTEGLAGLAGAILGAHGGLLGSLAQAGIQFGSNGLMLKYSRTDESQADAVGAILLYRAGYNPQALADFFRTLDQQQGAGRGPQFLSDHPNPGNREEAIEKEIAPWPKHPYRSDNTAFDKVRQEAAGVKAYSAEQIAEGAKTGEWDTLNRRNGAVFHKSQYTAAAPRPAASDQDLLPSSRMVSTDLGQLRIARPENWQVMEPRQRGAGVTIAPRSGVTGDAVGYGVVINGASLPSDQHVSLDQITEELVRSLDNGGDLRQVGDPQPIEVAGTQGRSLNMRSTSPFADGKGQSQPERDWLVTVPRSDGSILYFVFVAPQSDFERYRPTYESMLRSVEF
jgi:Zn-dependent protease with chaperone function